MSNLLNLKKPIVYLITKGNLSTENYKKKSHTLLEIIKIAAESNITIIQIREKQLPTQLVLELTKKAIRITKEFDTKVLVNNRFDIALAAKADGVHLTSNSIPTHIIRNKSPRAFIVGVSTHTKEEAKRAKNNGADFVTFSPIFPTNSKLDYGKPKGLKKLRELCETLKPFPILALGGIDIENYQKTLENGAKGFSGISFLNNAKNLRNLS